MSKEQKPQKQSAKRDPELKFERSEFFHNRLALPDKLKEKLKAENLDYRFLNAAEFRKNGGHASHWTVFKLDVPADQVGLASVTPEGHIVRGDVILGVRAKEITRAHKNFLNERNVRQQGYNKEKAKEMRKLAKSHGVEENTDILEGYED